ncbi:MAG: type II toxin-antitoxin system RelE/ParE family toxin [Tannerellaceae bacterium]|jgi:proteic killer suppression protein|nr:type II toxin-antitoxin system RelE/ParE family toxin [Tannerellaceae bacterium]
MIIHFEKEYLRDLYEKGYTGDKKHRYQPEIAHKYQKCIDILLDMSSVEALYKISSLNYEVLQEGETAISSIWVDRGHRIEFTVEENGIEPVVTVYDISER